MKKAEYYFTEFLKVTPFSLAIWRAIEAYHLAKLDLKYKKPILDLGCGFGEFSGVFFNSSIEVGIDIDNSDLFNARKTNKYKELIRVDARKMIFKDNYFNTIISNSVLEHIPNVHKVIKECYRVLKPGGLLIYTVPIDTLYKYLFYTSLFNKVGLESIANKYYEAFNKVFKHVNITHKNRWINMTKKAGFKIVLTKEIISKKATNWFDIGLLTSFPSQLGRWLYGKRFVVNLPGKIWLLNKIFCSLVAEEITSGSNLIIVAKK